MADDLLVLLDQDMALQQTRLDRLPALAQEIADAETKRAHAETTGSADLIQHWTDYLTHLRERYAAEQQYATKALAQDRALRADLLARTTWN